MSRVIALNDGAGPDGIAVNSAGTIAVVTERNAGKAAILNLTSWTVVGEVTTGASPEAAAIAGSLAVVVNRDNNNVSIIDLTTNTVVKTIAVGRSPRGVAVDAAAKKAWVTNENDGTVTVIDLVSLSVTSTLTVNPSARLEAIAVLPAAGGAFVTAPPSGQVFLLSLSTGTATAISANPSGAAGATDVAVLGSKVYFANQADGSVSVLTINTANGSGAGPITTIQVDLGARALAIDTKDNLLVVSNEGTGTLVLVDLSSGTVKGRVNAVQSGLSGDDGDDNRSDHDGAANLAVIASVSPATGKAGTSLTMTITGTNLTGASDVVFIKPENIHGKSPIASPDSAFAASKIQVNAAGTQLTATITIAASAAKGPRVVRVVTPNGQSSLNVSVADTFTLQ